MGIVAAPPMMITRSQTRGEAGGETYCGAGVSHVGCVSSEVRHQLLARVEPPPTEVSSLDPVTGEGGGADSQ